MFNTHRKGLPEWLKNARGAYLSAGVEKSSRFVAINHKRGHGAEYLECIDFVGISGTEIERKYLEWANPHAALSVKADQREAGQGNGGKGYLRQMFDQGYFISICDGKLSVVSFIDEKKHQIDFVPDARAGKDAVGGNPALPEIRAYAASWLKAYSLPPTHNITIVRGVIPTKPIDEDRLFEDLQQSPQARETLRTCNVQFFKDGRNPTRLEVEELPLHQDFPVPIIVKIPAKLPHGATDVPTIKSPEFGQGELELRVSAKPLHGQSLINWNRIDFHGAGVSVIGHKDVPELPLQFPQYASHIFGRCTLPLLLNPKDNYELQGRVALNDGPLSAALYKFVAAEADKILGKLAKSLENVAAGTKRKNLELLNAKLVRWIESKLSSLGGISETGDGEGSGKRERGPRERKVHDPAVLVKIHREKLDICLGVNTYELRAVAYDALNKPVPAGKVTWRSNDPSIVMIGPDTGRVQPKRVGVTTVVVRTEAGLTSMPMLVQVYEASQVRIKMPSPTRLGSNRRLPINVAVTAAGQTIKNPALEWSTGNRFIVTVGQDGIAVGGEIGDAQITAAAGNVTSDPLPIEVEKGAAGKPKGGGIGRPRILLSDQDLCPFDHSRVVLHDTDPPVYQRPWKPDYDNNVFWINLQHPLSAELLKAGEESVRWRTYHFERLVDVFVMIEVRRKFGDSEELDADHLLDEINLAKAQIYTQARTELFDLLYDEKISFSKLVA